MRNKEIIYPIIAYIFAIYLFQGLNWDHSIANFWFELEGNAWTLKEHWLTQTLIHKWGHHVSIFIYLVVIVLYLVSMKSPKLKPYNFGLKYLVISLPVATLSISALKLVISVDCPWHIVDFGGVRNYEFWYKSLFYSTQENISHCFPSGHASSAYTYFALYFFCKYYFKNYAKLTLITVILVGLVFGFAQQLRGAHYVSHDLTAALLCWLISLAIWKFMSRKNRTEQA